MNSRQKKIVALISEAPYMTADDVAKTLRVKRAAVYWTARKCNLKLHHERPKICEKVRLRIQRLATMGMSDEMIARRVGVGEKSVVKFRRLAGIEPRGRPPRKATTPEDRLRIAHMHLVEGHTYREISIRMGVTRGCVAGTIFRARRQNLFATPAPARELEPA